MLMQMIPGGYSGLLPAEQASFPLGMEGRERLPGLPIVRVVDQTILEHGDPRLS